MSRISIALLLFACGGKGKAIDDPQMQASAEALGDQSSALAATPEDADDAQVQTQVQTVGGTLQGLVSQHQALGQSNPAGFGRSADALARQTTQEEPVFWDGNEMCVNFEYSAAGTTINYDVVFDFTTTGTTTVMDGTYALSYDIGTAGFAYTYDVDAVYDAVTIEGGCVVSGSITVDWSASTAGVPGFGGGNESGRVVVTHNGCDDVVVTGS